MANTTTSPNMALPVPTVGEDPGPDWATNVDASLNIIDAHNHSSGSGVQITPSGLNISADLSFGSNNATALRSTRFTTQSTPISGVLDVGCLYESGVDLYFNDGSGNQIRMTQSGSVAGSSGTITGLPSGTASAAFSGGTFTFQSATNTPAAMAFGPITLGKQSASSNTITIAPANALAVNYNFTLPASLPGSTNYVTLDSSGNLLYNTSGSTGTGAVVLSSSPTFAGTISGTITSGSYGSTTAWTNGAPGVILNTANYSRINALVNVKYLLVGVGGGGPTSFISIILPIPTANLTVAGTATFATSGAATTYTMSQSGTTLATVSPGTITWPTATNGTLVLDFSYTIS